MSSLKKESVYKILRTVPSGKVVTYGQLATLAGNARAARAVGVYMRINPDAPRTPCHRVVASDGSLNGYSGTGGIKQKKEMLLKGRSSVFWRKGKFKNFSVEGFLKFLLSKTGLL